MSENKIESSLGIDPGQKARIGALTKDQVLRFFEAKGHRNIVLRPVDVVELSNDAQEFILGLIVNEALRRGSGAEAEAFSQGQSKDVDGWRLRFMQRFCPAGWIVLPIAETVSPLDFDQLTKLQSILVGYAKIRLEKGEPNRIDPCEKCGGRGGDCPACDGEGRTITFIEISDEEARLAEGAA